MTGTVSESGSSMSTNHEERWWRRAGTAKGGFRYVAANGRKLTAEDTLERIRSLVIPPAWTDVHISPDPARKVQVWGYDQAGRKQYRYSARHEAERDRRKWKRVLRVARLMPTLRDATNTHLKRDELDQDKVLATVVRLICRAYFRAGSERYAVTNRTFGICTLSKKHVRVEGNNLEFRYAGKRGLFQRQVVADTPLVEVVEALQKQPGRRLFKYRAGRGYRPVTAASVNRAGSDDPGRHRPCVGRDRSEAQRRADVQAGCSGAWQHACDCAQGVHPPCCAGGIRGRGSHHRNRGAEPAGPAAGRHGRAGRLVPGGDRADAVPGAVRLKALSC
jgi:DNA topoisomerase IB